MEGSPERLFLEDLERALEADTAEEPDAALTLIAGRDVELHDEELRGAQRRAVQLLAAGGDPRRGLDVEGRAVRALAEDITDEAKQQTLTAGLEGLLATAAGLPHVTERIGALRADSDLAWRWFASTLLADEVGES